MDGTTPGELGDRVLNPVDRLTAILSLDNIADVLEDAELARIGEDVVMDYETDCESMKPWRERMQRGVDLAKMVKEDKVYPWPDSANIKYPLITTAALQFNARAYPAIVPSEDVVRTKVWGADPRGVKAARGERVAAHMSYQLTCEMEEWEEETDKLLVSLPIVGTAIRKTWHDPVLGRPRCRLVTAGAFVVHDKVKSLADAPRCSEELSLFPSEIDVRIRSGAFRNVTYAEGDDRERQVSQTFIEQHCRLDLDGDDYPEPYIVTVHRKNRTVARIVADYTAADVVLGPQGVVSIKRGSYFTAFHFLPSLDGGFWGTGLGLLLGDISESVNGIINMMLDAGHMAALGGGFIGSEFRIKGGAQRFRPGEWKLVNARGADVRSSIVPMTLPGPDATLFQLLGLLIDAGKEVASVKDVLTGDTGGRNMTATTTLALIEQGMQVFTAAYKRIFRSLKAEYKLLARINAETLSPEAYNAFHDLTDEEGQPVFLDPAADYGASDMDIVPVADPRSVTKMQEAAKAELIMQMAKDGLVDPSQAGKRALEAASVANVDELLPQPDPMQQQMAMMGMKAAEADLTLKMVAIDQALADIDKTRSETEKNMAQADATDAGVRIDAMKARLEALRDGLATLLASGPGRMATAPGQPGGQGGSRPIGMDAAPGGNGGLLGGQPLA